MPLSKKQIVALEKPRKILYLDHTAVLSGGEIALLNVRGIACSLAYAVRLARFARRQRIAAIHTNSLKSHLYGGIAGRLACIPVCWHVRDHIDDEYLPAPVARLFRALARWIPQRVILNSESTRLRLNVSSTPRTKNRYCVIYDGCDIARFTKTASAMQSPAIVALVGRIAPWKGQHVLLQAAQTLLRRFPDTRFWIVGAPLFGEYDYERTLKAMVCELGLADAVEFLGFREDVPRVMAQADILVHASILGEPFGQVVIEGMASGKPLVATEGGAIPEIIQDGETGLLVPMGDAAALALVLMELLADPMRAHAIALAGQRRVRERFTIAAATRAVEAVYDSLLTPSQHLRFSSGQRLPCKGGAYDVDAILAARRSGGK